MSRKKRPGQPDSAALASLSNSYSVWLDEDGEVEEWTSDREDLYSDDQNAPKDMPSRIDTKKLLEDGVIDEDTYNAYVDEVLSRSDVDTGIRPTYGEQLLTLSTCEYSSDNGRYVVVAHRVGS